MKTEEIFTYEQLSSWGLLPKAKREFLIDQNIINIEPPSQEVFENIRKKWLQELGIKSQDQLELWEEQQRISRKEWQIILVRRWKWINWCKKNLEDRIPTHYLRRKGDLDKVIYSLLRVKDEYLANELFLRIKNKENTFEEICQEYSEGPEKKTGGKIGPVSLSQAHPLLAKLLQVSNPKQLWPPKKLGDWWLVVRMEKLITTELTDELRERLVIELGEEFLLEGLKKESQEIVSKT